MFVLGAIVIPLNPLPEFNKVEPSKVKPDSASNVFAVPEPVINLLSALLLIVVALPPPEAVTVTIPAEIADTSKLVEKLIVPAVPTVEPSCLITTPEPDAVMPVSPEPVSYTHLRAH